MTAPGALLQPLQKASALTHAAVVLDQRRQPCGQALIETGDLMGRVVFERAEVQPDFEHRTVSPQVGAAQVVDAQ